MVAGQTTEEFVLLLPLSLPSDNTFSKTFSGLCDCSCPSIINDKSHVGQSHVPDVLADICVFFDEAIGPFSNTISLWIIWSTEHSFNPFSLCPVLYCGHIEMLSIVTLDILRHRQDTDLLFQSFNCLSSHGGPSSCGHG